MESATRQKILNEVLPKYWAMKEDGWFAFMRNELKYVPDETPMKTLEKVIASVAHRDDTAFRSAHGVGKTTLGASVLLTSLAMVPEVFVMQISPTWSQVKDIFWNELRKWYANSQLMKELFELSDKSPRLTSYDSPNTWYAHGVASNSPGKIEGRHNAKRIFKIVDEAKAVEDAIDEATEGAMTSPIAWRLKLSTPSTPGGRFTHFYFCFTRHKKAWATFKLTGHESPRVSKKWLERMELYGKESQIYKARVEAEFPDASGDVLIPLQYAENFYDPEVKPDGHVGIGVDIARYGEDESVISVWQGDVMVAMQPFQHQSTTKTKNDVIAAVNQWNARIVMPDDIGVGGGITDGLQEHFGDSKAVTVIPFIANEVAVQEDKFKSIADEVLWEFAEALKSGKAKSLINDDTLIYQLSGYKKTFGADERIVVKWPDSKKDRSAEEKSPDRADAAFMGWHAARLARTLLAFDKKATDAEIEDLDRELKLEFAGLMKKEL